MTASSNAWVTHQTLQYITSDQTWTWNRQAVRAVQIQAFAEPPNQNRNKFLHDSKFECLGVWTCWAIHLVRPHRRVALPGRCSSNPTLRWTSKQNRNKFLHPASSNVWVSHQASRYIGSDSIRTGYGQFVGLVLILPNFGSKLVQQDKFLHQSKFECLGVALSLKIHQIRQLMHMAWADGRIGSNPAHHWIQTCSVGQIFASQQVQMLGCRIRHCLTLYLTVHIHDADRQWYFSKSNPSLIPQSDS